MITVGQRFCRWVVIGKADPGSLRSGKPLARWVVRCDCGVVKGVYASNLLSGKSRSCGCLSKEVTAALSKTHGKSKTRAYSVWAAMVQRTTNPNYHKWCDYGGRGIGVSPDWRSFEKFYSDMGDPPEGLTLERKDNSLGYSAANCIWATPSAQGCNRRSTVKLTFNGATLSVAAWARQLGMSPHTLANRIRLGWSVESALSRPVRAR